MMLVVGLLAVCTVTVLGISSGNTTMCDAHSALMGCTQWGTKVDPNDDRHFLVNRLNCTLNGTRNMAWVAAPVRTDAYTVRSGNSGPISNDVAFYQPGEYVTITVRSHVYKQQYLGLLLYAVNASGQVVGNFAFAPESQAVAFWTPSTWASVCGKGVGNAVLHANAAPKPYTMNFRWKAPPAGTGTVTFMALFKSGPANEGYFWFPNNTGRGDLVLSERNVAVDGPVPQPTWFRATSASQDCTTVCTANGRAGVDSALMAQTSNGGDGLSTYHPSAADAYYRSELCRAPFVSSCAPDSPGIDTATSFCYYQPATCPSWRNLSTIPARRRLCACLAATTTAQISPCPADQGWPSTTAGSTASLPCAVGQTGSNTRACSTTGIWGTSVNTCATVATCSDKILNQGEINIDCGGPCPACPVTLYCPTINCGSHGTCVEQNPPACNCNSSWTGNRCDVPPPNPCATWTCANGATCQAQSTVAVCLCVGTWTGPHCDQLPAATCTDGVMNQGEVGVDCGGPCPACATFFWDMGLWSACDRNCGGGTQTRGLTCTNSTGQVVASSLCANLHAPITSQSCNPDPCPVYSWITQSWEACNTVCGGGVQTRQVDCWSSVGPSIVTTPGLCTASLQPVTSQACNTAACTAPRWVSDPWGTCSLDCGGGTQTRANRCMKSTAGVDTQVDPSQCTQTVPSTAQPCNVVPCVTYSWFLCPNWGPCTASCGGADGMKGQAYRDLFCESSDSVQVDFSLCDPLTKPSNVLTVCNTWPCTDFNWMANGDWGPCNGTYRTRGFHCHAANGALAVSTSCANIPLPLEAIPCTTGKVQCYDVPPTPMFGLSAAPQIQTSVPFVLAAMGSLWSSPRLGVLSVALLGLSLMVPAEAHNWLHTPGRASFQASTVAPCQARKDSDLHAQVITGQDFTIKFATGHDRPSYFVSIRGADADILGADNFEAMVDDYLTTAVTSGKEDHLSDMNRRYHGYYVSGTTGNKPNQASYDSQSDPIGSMYSQKIDPSDSRYPFNARSIATGMYVYKDSLLANDLRASYQSATYPWILGAARLPHLYHLPDDFDGFHWRIPAWAAPGHVIVHWRWSGYYDCIDVDVRAGATPVTNPDGIVNASNHVWSQIDHCQYESPINILTQCMEVIDTVQPCINALGQGDWNVNNRLGLNVVPFHNPATVNPNFAGQVYIPWRNGACSSSWNRLPGTISETMLDWTTWLSSKTTVTTGTTCNSQLDQRSDLDLKRAVGYCVGLPTCTGIAWDTTSGSSVQSPGAKNFVFCSQGATSASSTWNLYQPKALAGVTYQTTNPTYTINFAPTAQVANTAAQTNMVTDAGYSYGSRNGQTYGWSCKGSVGCDWCCDTWQCANGALAGCCSGNIDFTYNNGANLQCPDPDPDGVWKYFNYALQNGVYKVTTRHQGDNYLDVDIGACNIEGVRMVKGRNDNTPAGVQLTTMVEVTDGKLTFNGDAGVNGGCWFTNWIKFSLQGPVGTWPQTWMPPAVANPVWEQNVGAPQAIGLVTIQNYDWFTDNGDTPSCSSWWLFKGNACYPNKASGWFNDTTSQGALVGVSNVSCLTSNCAGFVPCGWVQRAADLWNNLYFVDCNGVIGQYVFVKLPGANRYLTLNIQAYLYQPVVSDNPLVCYGLEARPATATYPEFIISMDPEDPIFYSTCYARNPDVIWLPTPAPPPTPSDWRFNGRCISCDSYNRNNPSNKLTFASLPVPWVVTDGQCVDCTNDPQPSNPVTPLWIQTYSSQCDDPADPQNTASRGLPPCAGSGFSSCNKQLYARGRTNSESTWGSAALTYTECQHLAANDPDCSSTISYYDGGGWSDCQCYRAHPCCGKCSPGSWSRGDATASPQVWHQVYDYSVNPAPDPFCSTGIKDTNSSLCCPATCKDGSGKNICGVQWQCSNVVGGGTCCRGDAQNLFVNMCSVHGPPCKLK